MYLQTYSIHLDSKLIEFIFDFQMNCRFNICCVSIALRLSVISIHFFPVKVPTLLHVEEKWRSVYEHLEVAPAGDKAQIFLTYSSGAGVFAYPRAIAQRINAQLYNYLRLKTDLNQRFGIVCMDFPAAPIIQVIIDFQLKEKLKREQVFNLVPSKASSKYTASSLRNKMLTVNVWARIKRHDSTSMRYHC